MKHEPVSFAIMDNKTILYEGSETEMLAVYEIIVSDLKHLERKFGKKVAWDMKVAYKAPEHGEIRLIETHKLHTL